MKMEMVKKRLKEERIDPKLFLRFLMQSIKEELPSINDLTNPYSMHRSKMCGTGVILGGIGGLFVSAVLMFLGYHGTWPFLLVVGMTIGKELGFLGYLGMIRAFLERTAISSAIKKGAFLGFVITFFISWNVLYSLGGAAGGMIIMEKVGFACYRAKLESLRLKGLV